MRYAVVSKGLTISQLQNEVKRCGGSNLRVAPASKQVFCDLEPAAIDKLNATGCIVSKVGGVKAAIIPSPRVPTPVAAAPVYSPEELIWATGLEDMRFLIEPPLYGEGFNIAIIDTGIRETHEKIAGHIIYSKNYTSDKMRDGFNHGCISGEAHVITSHCGIQTIRDLYEELEKTYGSSSDVVNIPSDKPLYTIGFKDGRATRTRAYKAHKIKVSGEVYRIKTNTGEVLTTPWHPFLIRHPTGYYRYVRADELRPSLELARANYPAGVTDEYRQLVVRYNRPSYGQKLEAVLVDEKIGYILGLITADGHISDFRVNNVVRISCANEDEAKIISGASRILAKPRISKDRTSWIVELGSRAWAITIATGLPKGKKSHIVDVPELIGKSPVSVQLAFLAGVIDGDGNFHNTRKYLRIVTASQSFAEHLVYLINSLGGRAYSYKEHDGRVRNYRGNIIHSAPYYYVVQTRGGAERYLLELISPYLRLKRVPEPTYGRKARYTATRVVQSIRKEIFDGYFYDLTTDTENYLAGVKDLFVIHNTGVASIITTVAPLCNILNLKVLNDEGEGTEEELTLAIDDCLTMYDAREAITPLIINMSLGSPDNGNPNTPMRVACRAAIERGIWVAAAAGNDGPRSGSILSPACEEYVFAVGSAKYDTPFTVSDFSGRGPTKEGLVKPEALMFGENIILASSESNTATIAKTGTSFATPFMSAAALLYHEGWLKVKYIGEPFPTMWTGRFPELEVLEVPPNIDVIIDEYLGQISAKPQGVALGKDNAYGYGIIAGGLIATALGLRPAVDISVMMSSLAPILGIGILSMLMAPMMKAMK